MTPEELEAIRERAERATPGPWWAWDRGVGWHIAVGQQSDADERGRPLMLLPEGDRTDIGRRDDAEFIAHARADVPALLAEVERLQRELKPARAVLEAARQWRVQFYKTPQAPRMAALIAAVDAVPCCDMHNRRCEPPSELCCRWCTEVEHPVHCAGAPCVLDQPNQCPNHPVEPRVTYIVVTSRIVGSPEDWALSYDSPLGVEFADRAEAICKGIEVLDHDDFCIATLHDGKLIAYGPGMDNFAPEDRDPLREIARQLVLGVHPSAPAEPAEETTTR